MDAPHYFAQTRRIVADAAPVLLVADRAVTDMLSSSELGVPLADFSALSGSMSIEPELPAGDSAAFVQYSSGSTTAPKGCVLTPDGIARQLEMLARALEIDPERDTGVVWLPLSHDMGLFGCALLTYWTGHRLVLSTPERFLRSPWTWFDDCAEFGATVSAAPGFGLDLAVRVAARRMAAPFPMRRLVLGGERLEPDSLDRAVNVLGPERLPRSSLLPAYGLAEAVLAVTMTPVGAGPTVVRVEREALANGELRIVDDASEGSTSSQLAVTSVGRALPGCAVEVDPSSAVGEISVRSPSLAQGYLGEHGSGAQRLGADHLRTGDLGFLQGENLFVTGRQDDLICVAGRNVYARDVEIALAAVTGIRSGNCAVVDASSDGGAQLVALVETREGADLRSMSTEIIRVARRAAGVSIDRVISLERGQLPKTPSGKIQRFKCRALASEHADA